MQEHVQYFIKMARSRFDPARRLCPNCGGFPDSVVSRKQLVTELCRCGSCSMMYRIPTDSREESHAFYKSFYRQGFTTTLPDEAALQTMLASRFAGTEKDYSRYITDIASLGAKTGARVFDFGCSWGYGSWQIAQAGYEVWACEINAERGGFARDKLGVRLVDDAQAFSRDPGMARSFDVFFTSHVIEHVPSPFEVFELASRLVRPGGLFVCYTPNGSSDHRRASANWDKLWGLVHPNFIDDVFLVKSFAGRPGVIASRHGREAIAGLIPPIQGLTRLDLSGYELLFAARL